jgi:hypothetical protein
MLRQTVRRILTYTCVTKIDAYEEQAKVVIASTLANGAEKAKLRLKVLKVFEHQHLLFVCVSNIQRSFDAKVEVLSNYWDKLYSRINTKAIKLDDKSTK